MPQTNGKKSNQIKYYLFIEPKVFVFDDLGMRFNNQQAVSLQSLTPLYTVQNVPKGNCFHLTL